MVRIVIILLVFSFTSCLNAQVSSFYVKKLCIEVFADSITLKLTSPVVENGDSPIAFVESPRSIWVYTNDTWYQSSGKKLWTDDQDTTISRNSDVDIRGKLTVIRDDNTNLEAVRIEKRTTTGGPKNPLLYLYNTSTTGTEADECMLVMRAGTPVTSNQRRYIDFRDHNDQNTGFIGQNASNGIIMYNQDDQIHPLFANGNNTGGNLLLNSTGTGGVWINQSGGNNPLVGRGGVRIFDGLGNTNQFFFAKDGTISLGYNTPINTRYKLNIGETYDFVSGGSFGGQLRNLVHNPTGIVSSSVFQADNITMIQNNNGFATSGMLGQNTVLTSSGSGTTPYVKSGSDRIIVQSGNTANAINFREFTLRVGNGSSVNNVYGLRFFAPEIIGTANFGNNNAAVRVDAGWGTALFSQINEGGSNVGINMSGTAPNRFMGKVGVNRINAREFLDLVGNFYIDGAIMPGGVAGPVGYFLTGQGAGNTNTWTDHQSITLPSQNISIDTTNIQNYATAPEVQSAIERIFELLGLSNIPENNGVLFAKDGTLYTGIFHDTLPPANQFVTPDTSTIDLDGPEHELTINGDGTKAGLKWNDETIQIQGAIVYDHENIFTAQNGSNGDGFFSNSRYIELSNLTEIVTITDFTQELGQETIFRNTGLFDIVIDTTGIFELESPYVLPPYATMIVRKTKTGLQTIVAGTGYTRASRAVEIRPDFTDAGALLANYMELNSGLNQNQLFMGEAPASGTTIRSVDASLPDGWIGVIQNNSTQTTAGLGEITLTQNDAAGTGIKWAPGTDFILPPGRQVSFQISGATGFAHIRAQ